MKMGKNSKEAYKILYIEFEKLRETRKQHIHELNSLQTEKSSLLLKIQDLEERSYWRHNFCLRGSLMRS